MAKKLLEMGHQVLGIDSMTDYYDVRLKEGRNQLLVKFPQFSFSKTRLEDQKELENLVEDFSPRVIIHLAAQAGVRYSLDNPRAYLDSNIVGSFNILEIARKLCVDHLLMASTSSVYGANKEMPFDENQYTDNPLTFYAATKKANEIMAHSYSHLWGLPITMVRFFTVYGPWGRPDMALFKFTKGIIEGTPIDIYNHGNMWRDFTFVDDLVTAVFLLIEIIPKRLTAGEKIKVCDTLSPVAPFRLVNMGNSKKVKLITFIEAIEKAIGKKALRNYMEIQAGDVPATWADTTLLKYLTGYKPKTDVPEGVGAFVEWYRSFYRV